MKYRIGFAVFLGACYLLLGLQASFGITAAHFWSDMLSFFGLLLVLPLALVSIWKIRLAGRLLLIDAGVVALTALFHLDAKDEASVAILIALPIAFAGLLLLKKQSAPFGPNE